MGSSTVLSLAVALAAACNGTTVLGETGSTTSGSSGTSGTGGTGSSGGDAGALTGSIQLTECVASSPSCGPNGSFSFYAMFNDWLPCVVTTSGACSLSQCSMVVSGGDDAGNLTIGGGGIPPGTVVMNEGNGLYNYSAAGPLLSAGQVVTVSGAGGSGVPAFGPQMVTVPSMITLAAPPIASDGGATTIDTSSDLTVSWTDGQAGAAVTFSLNDGFALGTVTCTWDATLGQGTVPQALLSQLSGDGYATYGQQDTTTFAAGVYTITASAALTAGGSVTYQ